MRYNEDFLNYSVIIIDYNNYKNQNSNVLDNYNLEYYYIFFYLITQPKAD